MNQPRPRPRQLLIQHDPKSGARATPGRVSDFHYGDTFFLFAAVWQGSGIGSDAGIAMSCPDAGAAATGAAGDDGNGRSAEPGQRHVVYAEQRINLARYWQQFDYG